MPKVVALPFNSELYGASGGISERGRLRVFNGGFYAN